MSRFNNLDKSTIEWETVRRNKTTPKEVTNDNISVASGASGGGGPEPSTNTVKKIPEDVNQNYVPRAIRDDLDTILYSSESVYTKIENLRKKIWEFVRYKKSRDIDWKTRLNIYIIHRVCKSNKQEILSSIIDSCDNVSKYVNAISSTLSGNTCLFDAIYYGSDQCINVLLNRGADIRHKNKAGEDVYNLLETGRNDYIKRHPGKEIFINERYDECLRLIKMADAERQARESGEVSETATKEASSAETASAETTSVSVEEEVLIKFRDSYDEESMKKDFTRHIEDIQDFKDFIKHIKEKLNLNDLLKTILEDEDIQDLFEDNPYAKKLC